jgi:hypothetical protein
VFLVRAIRSFSPFPSPFSVSIPFFPFLPSLLQKKDTGRSRVFWWCGGGRSYSLAFFSATTKKSSKIIGAVLRSNMMTTIDDNQFVNLSIFSPSLQGRRAFAWI